MALHRDIYWVGRQWAVTGHGIQACDQKQKSQFDIEASRLWEDGVLEAVRTLHWLNAEDFEQAVSIARKYFPEPLWKSVPAANAVSQPKGQVPPPRPPETQRQKLEMRTDGVRARFLPVWRIRTRGR